MEDFLWVWFCEGVFCLGFFWWRIFLFIFFNGWSVGTLDRSRLFYGKPSYGVLWEFCLVFKYCMCILYPATKPLKE